MLALVVASVIEQTNRNRIFENSLFNSIFLTVKSVKSILCNFQNLINYKIKGLTDF